MRKPFVKARDPARSPPDDSGQAILEYVLMLSLAVGVVIIIAVGFRRSIFLLWQGFTRDIAAACPGCPPNENAKFR